MVAFLLSSLFVNGLIPITAVISIGEGKNEVIAFNRNWTPLFLNDDPQSTGVILNSMVALRMAA